ncbi:MAG: hypothetical protein HY645_08050 [Acidobacteria bacterium]|nr:hypothetical protein [Acidobacteriota bacterium]
MRLIFSALRLAVLAVLGWTLLVPTQAWNGSEPALEPSQNTRILGGSLCCGTDPPPPPPCCQVL